MFLTLFVALKCHASKILKIALKINLNSHPLHTVDIVLQAFSKSTAICNKSSWSCHANHSLGPTKQYQVGKPQPDMQRPSYSIITS